LIHFIIDTIDSYCQPLLAIGYGTATGCRLRPADIFTLPLAIGHIDDYARQLLLDIRWRASHIFNFWLPLRWYILIITIFTYWHWYIIIDIDFITPFAYYWYFHYFHYWHILMTLFHILLIGRHWFSLLFHWYFHFDYWHHILIIIIYWYWLLILFSTLIIITPFDFDIFLSFALAIDTLRHCFGYYFHIDYFILPLLIFSLFAIIAITPLIISFLSPLHGFAAAMPLIPYVFFRCRQLTFSPLIITDIDLMTYFFISAIDIARWYWHFVFATPHIVSHWLTDIADISILLFRLLIILLIIYAFIIGHYWLLLFRHYYWFCHYCQLSLAVAGFRFSW